MTYDAAAAKPAGTGPPARVAGPDGSAPAPGTDAQAAAEVEVDAETLSTDDTLPRDHTQSILETTKQVAALLKASEHRFALTGSVAAYAHGVQVRLQHDTDFCIRPEDVGDIADACAKAGLEMVDAPEDWLIKARAGGEEIDLIHELAQRPVTTELLDRAEMLSVDSVWMPVLPPTQLLSGLLGSLSEHHCDFSGLLPIARTLRERIDWDQLREQHGQAPLPDAFFYLLERLNVIDRREATS
ncbi:nucleotidyltransferase family protein [Streptomyces sp. NPDC002889]|uniref:nucleotidyltransferase family protein n=1 Tax=Streptomyces sp. NPDC002889 TaxID=3364669 RepID=UPI0036944471